MGGIVFLGGIGQPKFYKDGIAQFQGVRFWVGKLRFWELGFGGWGFLKVDTGNGVKVVARVEG